MYGPKCRQTVPDWSSNLLSPSRSLSVGQSIKPLSRRLTYTAGTLQSTPITNDQFQQHALKGTTRAQDLLELACKTDMTYRARNLNSCKKKDASVANDAIITT